MEGLSSEILVIEAFSGNVSYRGYFPIYKNMPIMHFYQGLNAIIPCQLLVQSRKYERAEWTNALRSFPVIIIK